MSCAKKSFLYVHINLAGVISLEIHLWMRETDNTYTHTHIATHTYKHAHMLREEPRYVTYEINNTAGYYVLWGILIKHSISLLYQGYEGFVLIF